MLGCWVAECWVAGLLGAGLLGAELLGCWVLGCWVLSAERWVAAGSFIPDYIPAVGDIDSFVKVSSDGTPLCTPSVPPSVLHRAHSKNTHADL